MSLEANFLPESTPILDGLRALKNQWAIIDAEKRKRAEINLKFSNCLICRGKIIGLNCHVDHEEKRVIYTEISTNKPVEVELSRVEYIVNLSDINLPSSYYTVN